MKTYVTENYNDKSISLATRYGSTLGKIEVQFSIYNFRKKIMSGAVSHLLIASMQHFVYIHILE